jgi:hypothetical protein
MNKEILYCEHLPKYRVEEPNDLCTACYQNLKEIKTWD